MTWRDAFTQSFRLQRGRTSTSPAVHAYGIMACALTVCGIWMAVIVKFASVPDRVEQVDDRGYPDARLLVRSLPVLIARDTAPRLLAATDFTGRLTVRRPVGGGPWSPEWLTIPASALGAPPGTTGRVVLVPLGRNDPKVPRYARPYEPAVLPSATDGTTCIAYQQVHTPRIGAPLPPSAPRDTVDGPCLFILRFGLPSRARGAWLDARDWAPALKYRDSRSGLRVRGARGSDAPGDWASWFASALTQGLVSPKTSMRRSRRCLAGEDAACHDAVFGIPAGPRRHDREDVRLQGASNGAFPLSWISPDSWGVRDRADILRRQFGAERFANWWTSDDTTAAGFEAAFGVPEAEWARRILREEVALPPLPGFTAWEVLWAFVLVAGLVVAIRRLPAPTHGD